MSETENNVIHIHNHIYIDDSKIDKILEVVLDNQLKLKQMGQELDDLTAAVAKGTQVDESAITLLQGLKSKLDAAIAAGDPAALKALSDSLGTESQKLADAITANTPAA